MSQRLKELLDSDETFPLQYMHKLVGKNSIDFQNSLCQFEKKWSKLMRTKEVLSKGGAHKSVTYHFLAQSSEELISMINDSSKVQDLIMIL